MRSMNTSPNTDLQAKFISIEPLIQLTKRFKEKISDIKKSICNEIWEKLATANNKDYISIDDKLWEKVRESFEKNLASSIVKFLSTYICQTVSFKMQKSFFLFNLYAASDQNKFYLNDSLLR